VYFVPKETELNAV